MSDYSDATAEIIAKGTAAAQIMHDFANGGPDKIINTEGGPLPSLQRFLADNQEIINDYPELKQIVDAEIAARIAADQATQLALDLKQSKAYKQMTVDLRLGLAVTPEEFGAKGDGVNDDYPAMALAQATGRVVYLASGKTYAISRQLTATGHNQGWSCPEGKATILLLTGAGQFDAANYAGSRWAINACGVSSNGFNNFTLYNIHIRLQATALVRTVIAARIAAGRNLPLLKVEASGFKEAAGGVIAIDSLSQFNIETYTHDCGTSNDTLPTMQITGLCVDDNRENSVDTTNGHIFAHGHDIVISGAALVKYGPQTDGLNFGGTGSNKGVVWEANFDGVGECVDLFGSDTVGVVNGSNILAFGVKLIHGAQNNKITGNIVGTGLSAVVMAGSSVVTRPVKNNDVTLNASKICSLGTAGTKCVVWFDGPTLNQKPSNNRVRINITDSAGAYYTTLIQAGSDNIVEYTTDLLRPDRIITTTAGTGNQIRRVRASGDGSVNPRHYGGYVLDLSSTATLAIAPNILYGAPFRVNGTLCVDRIGISVVTPGNGSARLGVYEWYNGKPGELLTDAGPVSISLAGDYDLSLLGGEGLTLPDGIYFLAVVSNVAATIRATVPGPEAVNLIGLSAPASTKDVLVNRDWTYQSMPTPFGAARYSVGNLPNLYLRRTVA